MDMDLDTIQLECEEHMDKAVDYLKSELRGIRTGRATPTLVEFVKVDAYGSMTDLRQLAQVSVSDPTQLLIRPYDPSINQAIVKAIQSSGLGLNPMSEGKQIRLQIPPLTTERRQQLSASIKKMGEQAKIAIRNSRRDANKHIDQVQKDKTNSVTEDQAKDAKNEIQDTIKKHEKTIDELVSSKSTEIMES